MNNDQQEDQHSGPYYYIAKRDEQTNSAANEQPPGPRHYIDEQDEHFILTVLDATFCTKQPINPI
jgi:hypothetical protein